MRERASAIAVVGGRGVSPLHRLAVKRLLREAFGPASLPRVDRHYCLFENRGLIGFAAVSDRVVLLDGEKADASLIGLVAIARSRRGAGLGSLLLRSIVEGETGRKRILILNCGEGVKAFYLKAGFARIAPKAGYVRGGKLEWDEDPVLALGLAPGAAYGGVFIGEDF